MLHAKATLVLSGVPPEVTETRLELITVASRAIQVRLVGSVPTSARIRLINTITMLEITPGDLGLCAHIAGDDRSFTRDQP